MDRPRASVMGIVAMPLKRRSSGVAQGELVATPQPPPKMASCRRHGQRLGAWAPVVAGLCVTAGLGIECGAGMWHSVVVAPRPASLQASGNSPHLVVDRFGNPVVVYLERQPDSDRVWLASYVRQSWQRQLVHTFRHSGGALSGVASYALARDAKDGLHIYAYLRDYRPGGPVFSEHWLVPAGGRWQARRIRENLAGGAGMVDPQLVIDRQRNLHVSVYVHNAFGATHRMRHRYSSERTFPIETIPLPAGKRDSNVGGLCLGVDDRLHFVSNAMLPLNRGSNRHPNYPDTSLIYVTREAGRWSSPEVVRQSMGPDPRDTGWFVQSAGINLDAESGIPRIAYTVAQSGQPVIVRYAVRGTGGWEEQDVASYRSPLPPVTFKAIVFRPEQDDNHGWHLAYGVPQGVAYAQRQGESWISDEQRVAGALQGFAVGRDGTAYFLVSAGAHLVLYIRLPGETG